MGILSNVLRPQAINTEMERMLREHFGGGSTSSGVAVNSDSAMRLATVYACVKVLYQSVAQMPCHLMERVGEGTNATTRKAIDHPLYRVIHDQPNSWMGADELWGMSVAHESLRGDFLAFKTMVRGEVRELLPIDPSRVSEIKQNSDWSLTYKISTAENWDGKTVGPGREYRDYSQNEIFHVRGMSLNGYSGLNPIAYNRESIGVGMASEKFKAGYFGKGMHPGAILTHPLRLNPADHANFLQAYKIKYAGLNNSQDVMLVDDGMKIDFPPIKLVDQQFLENEKFTQSQVASLFRVPLMLLQAVDNPITFASAEQIMIAFVTQALAPIVVNREKAIYRNLLTEKDRGRYYAKFEMRSLLRGAFKEQMEGFRIAIDKCIMNPNEVRGLLEMNPYYPDGDKYETRTSTTKDANAPAAPEKGAAK
jgi:HK97 family phage portal protein